MRHVLEVLKWLWDCGLQVNVDKCKFSVTQVKYLGLIISTNGISMDSKKVQCILNWETSTLVKDVQAFLGFLNFYRQFVKQFSQRTRLLTELVKREQYSTKSEKKRVRYHIFEWTKRCKKVFEDLKLAFTTALVLAHYNAKLEMWVEIDFSDFVTASMLSQMHNSVLRPIAFFSKKMLPAECVRVLAWHG